MLLFKICAFLVTCIQWFLGPVNLNSEIINTETYDYIVIGGGTAGCIVASRLSENRNVTVLLLEAGEEPPLISNIPSLLFLSFYSNHDWNYKTVPQSEIPSAKFGCYCHAGKMLGGTASMNGAIYIRGNKVDYKKWVESGAEGWDWDQVVPYFERVEKELKIENSANEDVYQTDSVLSNFISNATKYGYRRINSSDGVQLGVSFDSLTVRNGRRQSSFTDYLYPSMKVRNNLIVETGATAHRILFDKAKRAVGVHYSKNGQLRVAKVNKEIIVTAGAINTAKLLMLSGIGPKKHLNSLNISDIANLPVGHNLQDHFGVTQLIMFSIGNILNPFSYGAVNVFVNTKLSSDSGHPDIQIILFRHIFHYFSVTLLLRPESVGSVRLSSSDPNVAPIIDARYLTSDNDLNVLSDGLRIASHLFKATGLHESAVGNCIELGEETDEYWKCRVRSFGHGFYHPIGTCKMGSKSNPNSVVDEKLNVIGVRGLRVADASVFPTQITANPQATVMMIAERVVDFIKEEEAVNI